MKTPLFRVVSHIQKFGDASKSPVGDTASPAGDAASSSGDTVVSHWRCIISFQDAHPPHSHPHLLQEIPHLPREMWSHLRSAGYVALLITFVERSQDPMEICLLNFVFLVRYLLGVVPDRYTNELRENFINGFRAFLQILTYMHVN